nr:hypothetical protein [Jiella endophytica]
MTLLEMDFRVLRPIGDRRLVPFQRVVDAADIFQHVATLDLQPGMPGRNAQGLLVGVGSFPVAAGIAQRVGTGDHRPQAQPHLEPADGLRGIELAASQDAVEHQRQNPTQPGLRIETCTPLPVIVVGRQTCRNSDGGAVIIPRVRGLPAHGTSGPSPRPDLSAPTAMRKDALWGRALGFSAWDMRSR